MTALLVRLAVAILPVVLFLIALILLDSYKLVQLRAIVAALAVGGAMAGVCFGVSSLAVGRLIDTTLYGRYVGPIIEETAKAAFLVPLIRSHKVGFLVDAAIVGFAVGTGFAVVENSYYVGSLAGAEPSTWIIRGFGTAIMHGATTCLVAIVSKSLVDRAGVATIARFLPGLLLAIVIHSAYNHFFFSPVLGTLGVLVTLPPLLLFIFSRSELALQRWLDVGFDADAELLELIQSGRLSESPVGRYLQSLRTSFRGEILVDLLCYLRLHVELALRAKGRLLMREHGFDVPMDQETQAKFDELAYLERSIGTTGKRALAPLLHPTSRELWQMHVIGQSRSSRVRRSTAH